MPSSVASKLPFLPTILSWIDETSPCNDTQNKTFDDILSATFRVKFISENAFPFVRTSISDSGCSIIHFFKK